MKIEENMKFEIILKGVKEEIPTERNIIFKAFNIFCSHIEGNIPNFKIILEKSVPTGAGLGGGSSNAASFILFLNNFLKLGMPIKQLVEIAAEVGSDVPFFLYGSPAYVRGKGEIIEPLKVIPVNKYLLLLYPEIIVNTGLAYSLFDKKKLTKTGAVNINTVRKTGTCSLKDWTKVIFNDFEEVVFEKWPLLSELKHSMELYGAGEVFMSGSGSTLVAVFDSDLAREKAFDEYRKRFETVRKIELLTG